MEKIINKWRSLLTEHEDDINAGAGILLFSSKGEILLAKRSSGVAHPHTIGTIGGHLIKGESPLVGAKREFYEETQYNGPFKNIEFLSCQHDKERNFTYFTFIATTDDDDFNYEPFKEFVHEVEWTRWLNFEKIKNSNNLHPGLTDLFSDNSIVQKIRTYISEIG